MKASFVDLRRKSREILKALKRNEAVTVLYRGKAKAILRPLPERTNQPKVEDQPAFGMWRDRKDIASVQDYVRRLRRGRIDDR